MNEVEAVLGFVGGLYIVSYLLAHGVKKIDD